MGQETQGVGTETSSLPTVRTCWGTHGTERPHVPESSGEQKAGERRAMGMEAGTRAGASQPLCSALGRGAGASAHLHIPAAAGAPPGCTAAAPAARSSGRGSPGATSPARPRRPPAGSPGSGARTSPSPLVGQGAQSGLVVGSPAHPQCPPMLGQPHPQPPPAKAGAGEGKRGRLWSPETKTHTLDRCRTIGEHHILPHRPRGPAWGSTAALTVLGAPLVGR